MYGMTWCLVTKPSHVQVSSDVGNVCEVEAEDLGPLGQLCGPVPSHSE